MNEWIERIGTERFFFDGAMGTLLQRAGLPEGKIPDVWNLENPNAVCDIHKQYVRAGCTLLKTNTFGSNARKLAPFGYTVKETIEAAVSLAKRAVAEEGAEARVVLDIGPTGKLLEPLGDLAFEDAVALFSEMVKAGVGAGAEAILIETMSDSYELKAAVLAAKENSELPIFCTMVFDSNGKLLTGGSIASVASMLEGLGVNAIGMNCGLGPKSMLPLVRSLRDVCSLPLIVNPNAGLPREENGKTYFDVSPAEFADDMAQVAVYASILGGCCGTTPAHLESMIARCGKMRVEPIPHHNDLVVSSYSAAVSIGQKPIVIGERINPTGKKRFKQALLENDMGYILREAITQESSGANVNVGLPEIDEATRLPQVVRELQKVTALPLQLDTSNAEAMERALRIYNGKPLINSVNGKEESLRSILPLVKKYGGGLIALTLDEDGIPSTAEGRLRIAERIVARAEEYGIDRREILVDVLTLPVSSDGDAAEVTLEALRLVKNKLGVKTVLGVSNVSFGLPGREQINAAFLTMAIHAGLDAAIINPNVSAMMQAYDVSCALVGRDERFEQYISKYSESVSSPIAAAAETLTLCEAVKKGLAEEAAALSSTLLSEHQTPLAIIDTHLVPALDEVGRGFEKGTLFLPQLLMSAEAAKAAFDVLKTAVNGHESDVDRPPIVLATVKGDIHDIGKNIVKVMLENYQFRVIDLGKDVAAETIVETALREKAQIVGLSALMTTTVPAMAETIERLHKAYPSCRVLVGGAVLTADYAEKIGADGYAKDAMAAVQYAKSIYENE